MNVFTHQEDLCDELRDELQNVPEMFHDIPFHEMISKNTPANAMGKDAERMLWHQRSGHPSDHCLCNAQTNGLFNQQMPDLRGSKLFGSHGGESFAVLSRRL